MTTHPPVLSRPQLHRSETEHHRRVTWTELFYDLIFVATFVQLGDFLSHHVDFQNFLIYVLLFIPIWWSWIGVTFYDNRFDSDDVIHRLLMMLQIVAVYQMAINVGDGLGEHTARFAMAYAFGRFILVVMYLRVVRHLPETRPLTVRYSIGFTLAGLLWLISAFVPAPLRYGLWLVGFLVDFGTPLSTVKYQLPFPPSVHHLAERFALLTIIVLGEGFLKVASGVAGQELSLADIILDVPGLIIAAGLWWIYFDNVAESQLQTRQSRVQIWIYTHLVLHFSLAALGVGVYKLVTNTTDVALPDNYRWLICGSFALSLLAVAIIEWSVTDESTAHARRELILRLSGVTVVVLLMLFGGLLTAPLVMTALGMVGIFQVAVDLYWRWGRQRSGLDIGPQLEGAD